MRKFLFIIASALFLLFACAEPTVQQENQVEEASELHLNNGKKWKANKETHIGMTEIKSIIGAYSSPDSRDSLVARIQKQTKYIIGNCNMKGEDHDQLHLVLVPILHATDAIAEAKDLAEELEAISVIFDNIDAYFEHFESE